MLIVYTLTTSQKFGLGKIFRHLKKKDVTYGHKAAFILSKIITI